MSVTMADIAKTCKVSLSTVSRALKNDPRLSEETRKRVQEVADQLHYVPRQQHQTPGRGRSYTIALIVTDISNPFFPEIVHGIEDQAFSYDCSITLWNTREDLHREKQYLYTLKKSKVAGMIMAASRLSEEQILNLVRTPTPCVLINRNIEGVPGVCGDYELGAYQATKYLMNLGHSRIALINGPASAQTSVWRERGFKRALEERGLPLEPVFLSYNPPVIEGGYAATLRLLSLPEPPTALFAYNDLVALGAMKAVREKGLKIPEHISIIGYDDIFLSAYLDPPLTTVAQPKYMMGKLAMDMLWQLINGRKLYNHFVRLKPELVVRSSCGVLV